MDHMICHIWFTYDALFYDLIWNKSYDPHMIHICGSYVAKLPVLNDSRLTTVIYLINMHILMHTCIYYLIDLIDWRVNLNCIKFVQSMTWISERHKPAFYPEHCVHCICKPKREFKIIICSGFQYKRVLHHVSLQ